MNKLILFHLLLFAFVAVGSIFDVLSLPRIGRVFLGVGILDLIIGIVALFGWPMIRGDISNFARLTERDLSDLSVDEYSLDHSHAATRFAVGIVLIGIMTLGVGLVLILVLS